MSGEMIKARFRHPMNGAIMDMSLPASTTFGEMLKLLYGNGFLQKKPADYSFIINNRLCAINRTLSCYIPLDMEEVDIEVSGMLTIMI